MDEGRTTRCQSNTTEYNLFLQRKNKTMHLNGLPFSIIGNYFIISKNIFHSHLLKRIFVMLLRVNAITTSRL